MLARFSHPGLVEVLRFWEQNGTAYMVMPLLRRRNADRVPAAPSRRGHRGLAEEAVSALARRARRNACRGTAFIATSRPTTS